MLFAKTCPDLKLCVLWLVLGIILVATVIYLSLTSSPVDLGTNFPYEDKVEHALAYFTLMFWFAQIYHGRSERILLAVIFISMGIMLEYFQSFNPHRYAEFGDMAANTTGVILGFYLTLTNARNCLLKIERWFT